MYCVCTGLCKPVETFGRTPEQISANIKVIYWWFRCKVSLIDRIDWGHFGLHRLMLTQLWTNHRKRCTAVILRIAIFVCIFSCLDSSQSQSCRTYCRACHTGYRCPVDSRLTYEAEEIRRRSLESVSSLRRNWCLRIELIAFENTVSRESCCVCNVSMIGEYIVFKNGAWLASDSIIAINQWYCFRSSKLVFQKNGPALALITSHQRISIDIIHW